MPPETGDFTIRHDSGLGIYKIKAHDWLHHPCLYVTPCHSSKLMLKMFSRKSTAPALIEKGLQVVISNLSAPATWRKGKVQQGCRVAAQSSTDKQDESWPEDVQSLLPAMTRELQSPGTLAVAPNRRNPNLEIPSVAGA